MSFKPIGPTATTALQKNLNEGGASVGTPMSGALLGDTSKAIEWMARHQPEHLDKLAVLRALSHSVALTVRYEGRYPKGPNGERMQSYMVATNCAAVGSAENMRLALTDLRKFETPADKRTIEGWLAELSVIVAKRQDDQFSEGLRAEAYSSRLSQYPADVVKYALFTHRWKFWPTWEELAKICDAKAGPRKHMIAALAGGPQAQDEERQPPTPEERKRMAEMVDRMFPKVPKEWRDAAMDMVSK